MNRNYKKISSHPFIRFFVSLKLTVVSLLLLFIITVWGTFYQVEYGLYLAQQKLFYPWFSLIGGWLPFPSAKIILMILFVNLSLALIFRFKFNRYKIGIAIIHLGLLTLLVSAGVTFYFAEDSHLTLKEGNGSNVSADYINWELAIWTVSPSGKQVLRQIEAFDLNKKSASKIVTLSSKPFRIQVEEFYPNTKALLRQKKNDYLNISKIDRFRPIPLDDEGEKNLAGIRFKVIGLTDTLPLKKVILFGGEDKATPAVIDNQVYFFEIRHRRYQLPMTITLNDFIKTNYNGTNIPRSYESKVYSTKNNIKREVSISMNKPMRYKDYTFFQSSFANVDRTEFSTFAVVKNPGRILPYLSCLLVGLGLIVHFLLIFIKHVVRVSREK